MVMSLAPQPRAVPGTRRLRIARVVTSTGASNMFKKKLLTGVASLAVVCSLQGVSAAADSAELEELRSRVEELEKKAGAEEVVDELGHKYHPIHSLYGLKISGGLTLSAHGISGIAGDKSGAAAVSADLVIESPVGDNGSVAIVLDFEHGGGLSNQPGFFVAPNGNPTGYNADLESFDDDGVHVTQVYYEHNFNDSLFITVGQLDPTGYFDGNELANDELSQFMANIFVNNPTIEWGGSGDFYGPGVRVTYFLTENFDISVGAFEGNGDYADTFDNPFVMVEANLKANLLGRDGNYRAYYWNRNGRDSAGDTATPTDLTLAGETNSGLGVSIDQMLTDDLGVWLRAGIQREKVAQFDSFVGAGLSLSGNAFGRSEDSAGFGYAATFMGDAYEAYLKGLTPAFESAPEHYFEAYYDYAVGEATATSGLHIAPDLQYIVNPGGDNDADDAFLYGVRMQVHF